MSIIFHTNTHLSNEYSRCGERPERRTQKSPGGNYSSGAIVFLYSFERSRKSRCINSLFSVGGEKEKNRNQIRLYHNYGSIMAEKAGFEPAHRLSRSTPLAGEPLRPTWVLLLIRYGARPEPY